jgi:hypothetical protein
MSRNDIGLLGTEFKWSNPSTDASNRVEIPHSLLLGPWSEEMIRHLFWVVKNGGCVNWVTSSTGEVS